MKQPSLDQHQNSTPTKKEILFPITLKEISLIIRLRKMEFGVMEVHKVEGELIRTIQKQNELLKDEDGIKEVSKNE